MAENIVGQVENAGDQHFLLLSRPCGRSVRAGWPTYGPRYGPMKIPNFAPTPGDQTWDLMIARLMLFLTTMDTTMLMFGKNLNVITREPHEGVNARLWGA